MSATAGKGNRYLNAWTPEDDQFLREHYIKMSTKSIGERLGRSIKAVRARAYKLGGYPFQQKTP